MKNYEIVYGDFPRDCWGLKMLVDGKECTFNLGHFDYPYSHKIVEQVEQAAKELVDKINQGWRPVNW